SYNGDGSFNASTSAALTQSVGKGSSSINLVPSVNPSVAGQSITLTATVTAVAPATGMPTATVTFFDGATNLGSAALDASGQATLSIASLPVGSHSLTASYSGDGNFNPSSSATLTQTVNKASSSISLASSVNPSVIGQAITVTVTVSAIPAAAGTPTGTVTFYEGATNLGSAALDASGQATLNIASLSVGSHNLTAGYNGDGNFLSCSSATLTQTVNQLATSTTVSSSLNPSI